MLLPIAVLAVILWTALLLCAPRTALVLTWFVILCYPQALLLDVLPMNIGVDDLAIISVAAALILRALTHDANTMRGTLPVVAICLYALLVDTVSAYTGAMNDATLILPATKTCLKAVVLLLFTIAMSLGIRTKTDIHANLLGFSWACILAYACAVMSFFVPSFSDPWQLQQEQWKWEKETAAARAFGPFNCEADLGAMACITIPLALGMLLCAKPRPRFFGLTGGGLLASSAMALLACKCRSGIFGIGLMLAGLFLVSRRRWSIAALLTVLIAIVAALTIWSQDFSKLVDGIFPRFESENVSDDYATRYSLWQRTIAQCSPSDLFFGKGHYAYFVRWHMLPHNSYLDAVFLWGLGGLIMFIVLVIAGIRWARFLARNDTSPLGETLSFAFIWSLVAIAGYGVFADVWLATEFRQSYFFFLVLLAARRQQIAVESKTSTC